MRCWFLVPNPISTTPRNQMHRCDAGLISRVKSNFHDPKKPNASMRCWILMPKVASSHRSKCIDAMLVSCVKPHSLGPKKPNASMRCWFLVSSPMTQYINATSLPRANAHFLVGNSTPSAPGNQRINASPLPRANAHFLVPNSTPSTPGNQRNPTTNKILIFGGGQRTISRVRIDTLVCWGWRDASAHWFLGVEEVANCLWREANASMRMRWFPGVEATQSHRCIDFLGSREWTWA